MPTCSSVDAVSVETNDIENLNSLDMLKTRILNVRKTDDQLVWAVDLIMEIKGYQGENARRHAARELREIPDDLFSKKNIIVRSMPGKGNANTPLVSFNHSLELVMVLPGKMAKGFRVKACDLLKRYLAGDATLIAEIHANATSSAPINEFARASMAQDAADPALAANLAQLAGVNDRMSKAMMQQGTQFGTTVSQLVTVNDRISSAVVQQSAQFAGVVAMQVNQLKDANAAVEKERHLRHQADGRYGSGIREANKEVRQMAAEAAKHAAEAEKRAAAAMDDLREERRERKLEIREAEKVQREMIEMLAKVHRDAAEDRRMFVEVLQKRA